MRIRIIIISLINIYNHTMKHVFSTLVIVATALMMCVSCQKQVDVTEAIDRQIAHFPHSTLQDIYKSFYQDRFGPGHMIKDTASFRAYTLSELAFAATDEVPNPYYEPVGAQGRFVRVYLRCVNEGLISGQLLMDAFLRSTQVSQPTSSWLKEWELIVARMEESGLVLPHWEEDKPAFFEAARINAAVHHSEAYRDAYHPHYRIIERGIFEEEIKPFLPCAATGEKLLQTLNERQISLVVRNNDSTSYYSQSRVNDLMHLVTTEPERLRDAIVADKRIGNAAATLIAYGGVREVHTNYVTHRGKRILRQAGVGLVYTTEGDFIYNRTGTAQCPMDSALNDIDSPQEGFEIIRTQFYNK